MKRLIIAAVIALTSTLALGGECPPCVVKHCPPGTKCRPESAPCPPQQPATLARHAEVVACPDPCPKCPDCNCPAIPECKPSIVYVPQKQAEKLKSHWLLDLSAGWIPSHDYAGSWDESISHRKVDPNFELHADNRLLLGAGITYARPSRWQFTIQTLRLGGGAPDIEWGHKPSLRSGDGDADDQQRVKHSALRVEDKGASWSFLATVGIPLD